MSDPAPSTERQRFAQSYWDTRAKRDALYAIWGDEAVLQPESADLDAFARSGEVEARMLLPYVHPDAVVLEIGCGIGRLLRPVARYCREAIGIDVSAEMVAQAGEYLASAPNARALHGDGANLNGVADESVDFVYSLLCLIHVDKRSAYRYLREVRRVLKPNGRALLQFQNILSPRGLELFQSVAESDYPFEFYTPEELRHLLASVGLETHTENLNNEFVEVGALRGDLAAWVRAWQDGFRAEALERSGFFADGGGGLGSTGAVDSVVVNETDRWRPCEVTASIHRRSGQDLAECYFASGVLFTPPRSRVPIHVTFDGSAGELAVAAEGPFATFPQRRAEPLPARGTLEAHFAVIPSGFRWTEETVRLFPSCSVVLPLGER